MRLLLLLIFQLIAFASAAQTDVLQRKVTFNVSDQTIPSILITIEAAADCRFTYATGLVSSVKKLSLSVNNKTVQEILPLLLGNEIQFKAKGNYIILSPVRKAPQSGIIISGLVKDAISV